MPYANNKGTEQPAHPHSLISTFAISKVSRFWLASIAKQDGLNLTRSKILEDTFSRDVAQMLL